jgi:Tol biopolymer transport system component
MTREEPTRLRVAVVLVKDGKHLIWIRALDALEHTRLAGTDNATDPFWSADSRFIAYFADAKLKKIDRSGGPVETLCDALAAVGRHMESQRRHPDRRLRNLLK